MTDSNRSQRQRPDFPQVKATNFFITLGQILIFRDKIETEVRFFFFTEYHLTTGNCIRIFMCGPLIKFWNQPWAISFFTLHMEKLRLISQATFLSGGTRIQIWVSQPQSQALHHTAPIRTALLYSPLGALSTLYTLLRFVQWGTLCPSHPNNTCHLNKSSVLA